MMNDAVWNSDGITALRQNCFWRSRGSLKISKQSQTTPK
jgi:hypothetical protein